MAKGAEQVLCLTLDFDCCVCSGPVAVTVRCSGNGFTGETEGEPQVAATSVPCPGCGQVNQLFFEPTGAIRAVKPFRCFRPLPVPSVN
jgi:hypothetical protein